MSETLNRVPSAPTQAMEAGDGHAVVLPFFPRRSASPSGIDQITPPLPSGNGHQFPISSLITNLASALERERISYCHWKSNWRLKRWLTGEGDLDLLIAEHDFHRFAHAVAQLGFIEAICARTGGTPDITHFYGWDAIAGRFIHLHVYRRLLVGHDLTNNYHIPIESLMLETASQSGLLPVPQAEIELVLFVLRKVLTSMTVDRFLRRFLKQSNDFKKTADELAYLEARSNPGQIVNILQQTVPEVDAALFQRCLNSLRLDSTARSRYVVRRQLERTLQSHARNAPGVDAAISFCRTVKYFLCEKMLRQPNGKRLAQRGALIALVGGDGAGKTTAVRALTKWLEADFAVRSFHFGKPRRAFVTLAVIVGLRAQRALKLLPGKLRRSGSDQVSADFPGYVHLVRWVCAARDRRRTYLKARRFANHGGIALCDRYLLPNIRLMDGPNISSTIAGSAPTWLTRVLLEAENCQYRQILPADMLLVLRVDPTTAVNRKCDEHEHHVRPRSEEIWNTDWSTTGAEVIDASLSPAKVLSKLQAYIWRHI